MMFVFGHGQRVAEARWGTEGKEATICYIDIRLLCDRHWRAQSRRNRIGRLSSSRRRPCDLEHGCLQSIDDCIGTRIRETQCYVSSRVGIRVMVVRVFNEKGVTASDLAGGMNPVFSRDGLVARGMCVSALWAILLHVLSTYRVAREGR
jgi:hypothetical protein